MKEYLAGSDFSLSTGFILLRELFVPAVMGLLSAYWLFVIQKKREYYISKLEKFYAPMMGDFSQLLGEIEVYTMLLEPDSNERIEGLPNQITTRNLNQLLTYGKIKTAENRPVFERIAKRFNQYFWLAEEQARGKRESICHQMHISQILCDVSNGKIDINAYEVAQKTYDEKLGDYTKELKDFVEILHKDMKNIDLRLNTPWYKRFINFVKKSLSTSKTIPDN